MNIVGETGAKKISNKKCDDSEIKIKEKISFMNGIPLQFFIECFGSSYKYEPL